MSTLDRLIAKGAYSCAGDLVLRNVVMGHLRNGDFTPTEAGLREAEIEDVEVREVKPRGRKLRAEEPQPMLGLDSVDALLD